MSRTGDTPVTSSAAPTSGPPFHPSCLLMSVSHAVSGFHVRFHLNKGFPLGEKTRLDNVQCKSLDLDGSPVRQAEFCMKPAAEEPVNAQTFLRPPVEEQRIKHQKRKERREEEKKVKPLEDWEVARMQQFSYPTAFPVWGAL